MLNLIKKIFKQADGQPDYHLGPVFDTSGSGRMVFNAEFGNPPLLARGAGRVAGSMRILQPPQVMVPLAVRTSGLGGTQAGAIELQPLTTHEELGI